MTLDDRNVSVMGGRQDDVMGDRQDDVMGGRQHDARRTPKQNRKRPLSAVLEEFEVEDWHLRENAGGHDLTNADDTARHSPGTSTDRSGSDTTQRPSPDRRPCSSSPRSPTLPSFQKLFQTGTARASSPDRRPCSSSPRSPTLPSFQKLFQTGSARAPEHRQTSPKIPRQSSPLAGARRPLRSPNLSPKIPRRGSSGYYSSSSDVNDSDDDISPTSDMTRLRQMADRLCLSTRRPSVLQWRAQYVESPEVPVLWHAGEKSDVTGPNGDEGGGWTVERAARINTALDWIRHELQAMRTQDQQLAGQLLTLRSDLHRLKLTWSCEEHRDMLDDVQCHLEELHELADVLDLPTPTLSDSPLKHLGVTRMNLTARRFSTS